MDLNADCALESGRDAVKLYGVINDISAMDLNFGSLQLRAEPSGKVETIEVCLPRFLPLSRPLNLRAGEHYLVTLTLDPALIHAVNSVRALGLREATLSVTQL